MAEQALTSKAFQPLARTEHVQALSRPSLSYWQDAWIRLRANRRALLSLYLVVGLLLFTFLGPWLWQVDPSVQDVDQISQPPGADRTVTLVADYQAWHGDAPAGQGLRLAASPNTQAVRLVVGTPLPESARLSRVSQTCFEMAPGNRAFRTAAVRSAGWADVFSRDRLDLQAGVPITTRWWALDAAAP